MQEDLKGIKIKATEWTEPIIVEGTNRNPYMQEDYQNKTDADGFITVEKGRLFDTNKHYLLPLPTKEILINPNLKQNPGW
jgi:hypothetical protein